MACAMNGFVQPSRQCAFAAVIVVAAVFVGAIVSPAAHAASDADCGDLTGNLTLLEDLDCTGYTGPALTILADGITIEGNGFRILAPDSSHAIHSDGFDDLTVRNVRMTGWCHGYGLYATNGSRLVVDNVQADSRSYGAQINNFVDVTLHSFHAESALTRALGLYNITGTIDLQDLRLTNSAQGLYLQNITGPLLLDTTAIPDITGNDTSIHMASSVIDVTLDGLTLDGYDYGVWAYHASNSDLTFQNNLDLSGTSGVGRGIYTQGSNIRLQGGVIANRRYRGVEAYLVEGLSVSGFRASGATSIGLYINQPTAPLTLEDLTLTDSNTGLEIATYVAPVGTPLVIDAYTAGSGVVTDFARNKTPLYLASVDNVVVGLPQPAAPMVFTGTTRGLVVTGAGPVGNTVQNVDIAGKGGSGTGIYTNGVNNLFQDVTVTDFNYGIEVLSSTNLTLRNVASDNHGQYALKLTSTTLPLTLEQLSMTRSEHGIYFNGLPGDSASPLMLDAWDGSQGAFASLLGNNYSLRFDNVQNVTLTGLRLDGRTYGLYSWADTNDGIHLVDIDATGHGAGTGVGVSGSNVSLTRVTANDRANGLYASAISGLQVTDAVANSCTAFGMRLLGYTTDEAVPILSGLELRNNNLALEFYNFDRSYVFDGDDVGLDVTGSDRAIKFTNSSLVTIRDHQGLNGLTGCLGNTIEADANSHEITLENVDVSGTGPNLGRNTGYGIVFFGGYDHVLTDIVANHKLLGVYLTATSNVEITNLTARSNEWGLQIYSSKVASGHLPPTLTNIDLRDNRYGLGMGAWDVPFTLDGGPGAANLQLDNTETGIRVNVMSDVTFTNITAPSHLKGIEVYSGGQNLTFDTIDVSGGGTGHGIQLGTNGTTARAGSGLTLRNIDASDRLIGVEVFGADNLTIDDLTASRCHSVGLYLRYLDATTGLSLRNLTLTDNNQAFSLTDVNGADGSPVVIDAFDEGVVGDPTDDTGVIADVSGNQYGISASSSNWLTFKGLTVDAETWAMVASSCGNVVFEDLDLSGRRRIGHGLDLRNSTTVTVTNVTSDWREYGLDSYRVTDLGVATLRSAHSTYGLYVDENLGSLALADLHLTNNVTGFYLNDFVGPLVLDVPVIADLTGSNTGIQLRETTDVQVLGLDLNGQNRAFGIYALGANPGLLIQGVKVSGTGQGTGIIIAGAGATLRDIEADDREFGVRLSSASDLTLDNVRVRGARDKGIWFGRVTYPITLSNLAVDDSFYGLYFELGTGDPFTLDATHFASLSGNNRAIYDNDPQVTVDDVSLNLSAPGPYHYDLPVRVTTAPGPDPDCGATLDGIYSPIGSALSFNGSDTYTLTQNMDCSRTVYEALFIGADGLTLDGGGFAIEAPFSRTVVEANGLTGVTIQNLVVSGTHGAGEGVEIDGSTQVVVSGLTAHDRGLGLQVLNSTDVSLTNIQVARSKTYGLELSSLSGGLSLAALSLTDGADVGLYMSGVDGDALATGSPLVLDSTVLAALSGNDTPIRLNGNVANLHLMGTAGTPLVLDGFDDGLMADVDTNRDLTLSYVQAEAHLGGSTTIGIALAGDNHSLSNIQATGWTSRAVEVIDAANLSIAGVTASDSGYGLRLENLSGTTSLSGLDVPHNGYGLYINGLHASLLSPFVVDPSVLLSTYGADYGLTLYNTSHVSVEGNGPAEADRLEIFGALGVVVADGGTTNPNMALTMTDVSLQSRVTNLAANTGLDLDGDDHALDNVHITECRLGFTMGVGDGLIVDGLNVTGARDTAVRIDGATGFSLTGLSLTNSQFGLDLRNLNPATRLVIDDTALIDVSGTNYCVAIRDSSNLEIFNLTLPCRSIGIHASYTGNSDLYFTDVDVSGQRQTGSGLLANGPRQTLTRVTANDRLNAVQLYNASGLTIDTLNILRAQSTAEGGGVGLLLSDAAAPISLTNLKIYDSGIAIKFDGFVGDPASVLTLGPAQITRRLDATTSAPIPSQNHTGVWFGDAAHIKLQNLDLDARRYGVDANRTTNSDLQFSDLDVTGVRRNIGVGLYLKGPDHQVTRVHGEYRSGFMYGIEAEGLSIDTLTVSHSTYGLYLATYASGSTPPTLSKLTLTDNRYALGFNAFNVPLVVDGTGNNVVLGDNEDDIYVYGTTSGVTFQNLRLDGWSHGVHCFRADSCTDLVIQDIDASGGRDGDGFVIRGDGNVLRRLQIHGRRYAIEAWSAGGLEVTELDASHSVYGLLMRDFTSADLPPTLYDLSLVNNTYGLSASSVSPSPPLVLDGDDMLLSFTDSDWGVSVNGTGATVRDLDVSTNQVMGVWLGGTNSFLENVNASGAGLGIGITAYGDGNTITGGQANDREYGVSAYANNTPEDLTINGLEARRNSVNGLFLPRAENPTFTGLRMTDNAIGLNLEYSEGPIALGPSNFTETSGNRSQINVNYASDVVISGLTLHSTGTAISAGGVAANNITVLDTDVSGYCRGYGLTMGGENVVADGVTAARRDRAIYVGSGFDLVIKDSLMGASARGLDVAGSTSNLNATVIAYAGTSETLFRVSQTHGSNMNLQAGETIRVHLDTGVEEVVVELVSSSYIYLDPLTPLTKPPELGDVVQALDVDAIRLTVETSDICANDIGLNNVSSEVTATGDYWRSADGPTHASVPGGDGDSVEGTGPSTVSPFEPLPFDNVNPYCNLIPEPDAGPDQIVCEGDAVTLDASASTDADGDQLAFRWSQQPGGSAVALSDDGVEQPTFDAPSAGAQTLGFEVLVDDGDAVRRDIVSIGVEAGHTPPTVSAGSDQTVDEQVTVNLDGATGTSDPDGLALTYAWVQVGTPAVTLSDASSATPSFDAPAMADGGSQTVTLVFELTV
ncbi:MAG: hypothetical protein ACI9MR_000562, partial [Myxococcota bacterium]